MVVLISLEGSVAGVGGFVVYACEEAGANTSKERVAAGHGQGHYPCLGVFVPARETGRSVLVPARETGRSTPRNG